MLSCTSRMDACPPGFLPLYMGLVIGMFALGMYQSRATSQRVMAALKSGTVGSLRVPVTGLPVRGLRALDGSNLRLVMDLRWLVGGFFILALFVLGAASFASSGPAELKLVLRTFVACMLTWVIYTNVSLGRAVKRGGGLPPTSRERVPRR